MKKKEIKKLSKDEALKNLEKFKKDLFNFRFQKINSQITNPAKIGETKKNIDKFKKDLFNFRFQKTNSQITNPAQISQTKRTIARLKTLLKGKLNA